MPEREPLTEDRALRRSARLSGDVLGAIGDTPLVQLRRVVTPRMGRILVKLEGRE